MSDGIVSIPREPFRTKAARARRLNAYTNPAGAAGSLSHFAVTPEIAGQGVPGPPQQIVDDQTKSSEKSIEP